MTKDKFSIHLNKLSKYTHRKKVCTVLSYSHNILNSISIFTSLSCAQGSVPLNDTTGILRRATSPSLALCSVKGGYVWWRCVRVIRKTLQDKEKCRVHVFWTSAVKITQGVNSAMHANINMLRSHMSNIHKLIQSINDPYGQYRMSAKSVRIRFVN